MCTICGENVYNFQKNLKKTKNTAENEKFVKFVKIKIA